MAAGNHASVAGRNLPSGVYSLQEIADLAARVFDGCGFVERAYVFGSYARGEARPDSDIDFAIVLDDSAHVGASDVSELRLSLEDALAKDVDVATVHSTALAYGPFQGEIKRDGRLVYDGEDRTRVA